MIPDISGPISLDGKIAIVTGASRGIGKAIALALIREGAYVGAFDVLPCESIRDLPAAKEKVIAATCDVTNELEIKNAVESVVSQWGRVDILVNNAAIVGIYGKELEDFTIEEWEELIKTNLESTFLMTREVWPYMKQVGKGKVICIGSIAGKIGGFFAGPHYCASKSGIHGFVKWAAKNGAKYGIHVNGIAPGPTVTKMTADEPLITDNMVPLGRLGQPEDIAEVVIFLSSQASNFITGCVLDVNGGLLMTQ